MGRVLEVVEQHPLRFPVLHADVRRVLTRRFPYAILYRGETVAVLSVVHQARARGAGRGRGVPPAKAVEMYMPETFGRSSTDRVIVE